jgi:hypothetical protein
MPLKRPTVPGKFDRVNVQALIFWRAGIVLLRDNLHVFEAATHLIALFFF